MRNIKSLFIFLCLGLILVSCETTQEDYTNAYNSSMTDSPKETKVEMDRLTNGGKTFPDAEALTAIVSNPGNINYDNTCVRENPKFIPEASNYWTGKKDPGYIYSLKNYPRPAKKSVMLLG